MLLYPVPTQSTLSEPVPAVIASALITLTVTPVTVVASCVKRNPLHVPPVVAPGVRSMRIALPSTAAAPPKYVTARAFTPAVVVANPVLVICTMSVVGAALAWILNTPAANMSAVAPPVPDLSVIPVAPVTLPTVITLALALVPMFTAPVVPLSNVIAFVVTLLSASAAEPVIAVAVPLIILEPL